MAQTMDLSLLFDKDHRQIQLTRGVKGGGWGDIGSLVGLMVSQSSDVSVNTEGAWIVLLVIRYN